MFRIVFYTFLKVFFIVFYFFEFLAYLSYFKEVQTASGIDLHCDF